MIDVAIFNIDIQKQHEDKQWFKDDGCVMPIELDNVASMRVSKFFSASFVFVWVNNKGLTSEYTSDMNERGLIDDCTDKKWDSFPDILYEMGKYQQAFLAWL